MAGILVPTNDREKAEYKREKLSESRRRRLQGAMSLISGATGLTAAGLVTRGKVLKKPRITEAGYTVGTIGGGVGGLTGLTYGIGNLKEAGKAKQESRKRIKTVVAVPEAKKPVAKRQGEPPLSDHARYLAARRGDERWRENVAPSAAKAHDTALPAYKRHYALRTGTGLLGTAAGTGLAVGALESRSLPTKAKLPLAMLGGTSAAFSASEGRRGARGVRRVRNTERAIRARGFQRGIDAGKIGATSD